MSRHLDIIRDFLDIIVAESSFSPYYVQEISLTMSSLLDTMGIAWRAKLSMQLWCQGLRPYQASCKKVELIKQLGDSDSSYIALQYRHRQCYSLSLHSITIQTYIQGYWARQRWATELRSSIQCICMSSFQIYTYNFNILYFERLKLGNIIYSLYCQYLQKELVQNIHILLLISSNFVQLFFTKNISI